MDPANDCPIPPSIVPTITSAGHQILWLPPYHPQFTAIELMWKQCKDGVRGSFDEIKFKEQAFMDILNGQSSIDWDKCCDHVITNCRMAAMEMGLMKDGKWLVEIGNDGKEVRSDNNDDSDDDDDDDDEDDNNDKNKSTSGGGDDGKRSLPNRDGEDVSVHWKVREQERNAARALLGIARGERLAARKEDGQSDPTADGMGFGE